MMQLQLLCLHQPCKLSTFTFAHYNRVNIYPHKKNSTCSTLHSHRTLKLLTITTHIRFCSQNDVYDDVSSTQLHEKNKTDESEELELLSKPNPVPIGVEDEYDEYEKVDRDEALAPFLKFFKSADSVDGDELEEVVSESSHVEEEEEKRVEEDKKVDGLYYEPLPGDFVVGVVVSGNENRLDVNVGADLLGIMLTKEVLPFYGKELDYLLCDIGRDSEEFLVRGKMGIVKDDDVVVKEGLGAGKPVVESGTVLFAEVLGRTLSGRPLLSTRRLARKMAWHRVRQVLFSLSKLIHVEQ